MENICLDTTILVDFLRNKRDAVVFIEANEIINHLATTYVNLFELYYGAALSANPNNNFIAVENIRRRLTILNLSEEAVKQAGKILADLEKQGKSAEIRDVLIGSIALAEGFSIKTSNIKHFTGIKGLKIDEH